MVGWSRGRCFEGKGKAVTVRVQTVQPGIVTSFPESSVHCYSSYWRALGEALPLLRHPISCLFCKFWALYQYLKECYFNSLGYLQYPPSFLFYKKKITSICITFDTRKNRQKEVFGDLT